MSNDENTDPLAGYIEFPNEWAAVVRKPPRTVQRHKRLGDGPRLTRIGNSAYVSPENGRDYIRSKTETAA